MASEQSVAQRFAARAAELAAMVGAVGPGDAAMGAALERLGEVRRLFDAVAVELCAEAGRRCDEEGFAVRSGEKSAAALVAAVAQVGDGEARAWCEVGTATRVRYSLTGEVLAPRRPEIVDVLAGAVLPASVLARIIATAEEVDRRAPGHGSALAVTLVEAAPGLAPRELSRLCRHAIDCADPDGVEPHEEELRRRRGVQIAHLPDGMSRWIVTMDPESAGFLTAALDARAAPRRAPRFGAGDQADVDAAFEGDERTLAQRRLDALVGIARTALRADDGAVAGSDVTMLVTVPLEVLRTGAGAGWIDGVGVPVSAGAARRLAACAEIVPVVLGRESEPLDLGRAARLFSRAQRRALAVRDGGCVWPGCMAPPGWCEVAHVQAWARGGSTDLANAMLLCPFHHRRFDRDGWTLEHRDGARWLIPPGSIDAWRTPRRLLGAAERTAVTATASTASSVGAVA